MVRSYPDRRKPVGRVFPAEGTAHAQRVCGGACLACLKSKKLTDVTENLVPSGYKIWGSNQIGQVIGLP